MPLEILTDDILSSDATDGEVRVTLGDASTADGHSAEAAVYGVDGFVGRPNPPDAEGNAAQALYLQDGDDAQVLGTRDNRWADKVGTMDPGDRAIVTDGEARVFVKQSRDAVVLYTVSQPEDKSMLIDIGGAEGEIQIVNGGSFITMTNDSIVLAVNGGGSLIIDADGVRVIGNSFQAITPAVQLGDVGGGTPPPAIPGSPGCGIQAVPPIAFAVASTKVFVAP